MNRAVKLWTRESEGSRRRLSYRGPPQFPRQIPPLLLVNESDIPRRRQLRRTGSGWVELRGAGIFVYWTRDRARPIKIPRRGVFTGTEKAIDKDRTKGKSGAVWDRGTRVGTGRKRKSEAPGAPQKCRVALGRQRRGGPCAKKSKLGRIVSPRPAPLLPHLFTMDRSRRELPGIQLPPIHTLAPLPAPIARPAAFAVAHRTQDGHQAYDYGDLHETASGGGYSYYSSSQTPAPREMVRLHRPRPSFPITIAPPAHPPPRPHPPPRKFVHPPATYVAPAHPHSHHLHSIPPRDKSTRTLILDHLLWMHARARFGAARGELGVGTRPHLESKDACLETLEDHGVMGLGLFEEGLDKLSYPDVKLIEPDPDVLTLGPPDLALAAAYRAKATGLEKVLTAMLDQTPAPDPIPSDEDDMLVDSASSTSVTSSQKLPNSVRLRLALSLLVNELFSPEPEPASAPTQQAPPALLSLAQVAPPPPASLLCSPTPVTLPSFQQFTSGAPATSQSIFNSIPRGQGVEGPWTYPRTGPAPAYFRDGVLEDPYVHQTQRCVRHLSRTCQAPACTYVPAPTTSSSSRPAMVLGVQPGRTSTIGAGLGRTGGPPLRLARTTSVHPHRVLHSVYRARCPKIHASPHSSPGSSVSRPSSRSN
ncbi:hypothetical protein AG1IA_05572 [Rhizoctonia solani AG-1 IA]|uniref:Uncharacterized protein n=1 Tax=Thanatephorus cucumeris (strain AG1-IA) TaxID=983506 RepID=L8WUC6_THACA|nr:hypothetical protein AG1IA_05572 [Rhizoctonia solani AG-1 IA]